MKREQKFGRGLIGRRVLYNGRRYAVQWTDAVGVMLCLGSLRKRGASLWPVDRSAVKFLRRKMERRLSARERQALEAGFRELRARA
jgi:hypothetical protein